MNRDLLKDAKNVRIKKVEIWEGMPFFQVYRDYSKEELTEETLKDIERKKNLPPEELELLIPDGYLIGQFNSKELAENYVGLIELNQRVNSMLEETDRRAKEAKIELDKYKKSKGL